MTETNTEPGPRLTPAQRLEAALGQHQAGQLVEAERAYRELLAEFPDDPNCAHFLGMLRFQLGEFAEGVALVSRALESDPSNAHAWNNLGNMYFHQERGQEAEQAYRRATQLGGAAAPAWYNLALIYLRRKEFEQALTALREAIRASRGFVDALQTLAFLYYRLGLADKAQDVYEQWAAEAPDDPTPRHMLAATSGHDIPDRAADGYIVKTFNRFAASFDSKLELLDYRAPQLVAGSLINHPLYQSGRATVLDAGCGTGWCGPLLKSTAGHLVGVDLSPKMLDRARERGVYDQLHMGELTAFMRSSPQAFDIIVAADVLCYFGKLDEALQAAHDAFRPGGALCFSVEALLEPASGEDFRLQTHGRYSHARSYLERDLAAAGFAVPQIESAVLRTEFDQPVHGFVVFARLLDR